MTSWDDSFAFHHILLRPSFRDTLRIFLLLVVNFCWCVLPLWSSASPWVRNTPDEAEAAFLRSTGIPARAYFDDSFPLQLQSLAWDGSTGKAMRGCRGHPRRRISVELFAGISCPLKRANDGRRLDKSTSESVVIP